MDKERLFASRKELYEAGLHNSYQKGIGKAKDGSENISIVLSGGYVDDEDFGDSIIYTGEGGRDSSTGKQIKDQAISGGNKDLLVAFELGSSVYVTRGSNHKSEYSPVSGYSYAGKFLIRDHWIEKGVDGFNVVRFELVSERTGLKSAANISQKESQGVEYTSTRIVRETKIAKQVKKLNNYRCQVCGDDINLPSGNKYAKAAHIKPLGRPHNCPDIAENLLCLCPNHHLMFDKYCYSINPKTLQLVGLSGDLIVPKDHDINSEYLEYHYENYLSHR